MGEIFEQLCRGTVLVVDDRLDEPGDLINEIVDRIESYNLPVIKKTALDDAHNILGHLQATNFTILDWKFGQEFTDLGVTAPDTIEDEMEQEVIAFIKELRKVCLAPVFITSNESSENILEKLESSGITVDKNSFIFVSKKSELCETETKLIESIESWIHGSAHIYLAKWLTNEWMAKNTAVFWDMYDSCPDWPRVFYKSFKDDGVEPLPSLVETMSQLINSEIRTLALQDAPFEVDPVQQKIDKLRDLYKRLVYTEHEISADVKPGDIFRRRGKYYLNIRPECDTTARVTLDQHDIYLIQGKPLSETQRVGRVQFEKKFGFIEKEAQILMFFLGDHDVVEFDKRKLSVEKYGEWKKHKVCRVLAPFITRYRQSFAGFLGRFGIPSYPRELTDSLYPEPDAKPPDGEQTSC